MSRKFSVEVSEEPGDFPMTEMSTAEVAIVTKVPAGYSLRVGAVVVKAHSAGFAFVGEDSWGSSPEGYRVRRLRPGETVTITGK